MNNLAVWLDELGRDLDHALSLVDRAISRSPELSAFRDTRGQVLAAMVRTGDATQAYETSVSLQPESLKWRVNLACHLAATQKWQRTREVHNEIESLAGQREDGLPRALRDEYLVVRKAGRTAQSVACFALSKARSTQPAGPPVARVGPIPRQDWIRHRAMITRRVCA